MIVSKLIEIDFFENKVTKTFAWADIVDSPAAKNIKVSNIWKI
jgi:hypothetical protein